MRHWFVERVWSFACWLERQALGLQDWYWRIRPEREAIKGPLSDIVAATLANRSGEIAENMLRNNALLQRLSKGE